MSYWNPTFADALYKKYQNSMNDSFALLVIRTGSFTGSCRLIAVHLSCLKTVSHSNVIMLQKKKPQIEI